MNSARNVKKISKVRKIRVVLIVFPNPHKRKSSNIKKLKIQTRKYNYIPYFFALKSWVQAIAEFGVDSLLINKLDEERLDQLNPFLLWFLTFFVRENALAIEIHREAFLI